MYLEKLKIFGFKSFAKKTILELPRGITAIVGPNGCGKSNVVDAIRWVLGEQKAGTLRSDRMESVIFNGAKDHKPLGMAEVSLVIQNDDNVLPVDYAEVVITRRLFRSGESQYLLNNNPCRLKDINDLLMDTGLAPDAYSVIELSMVEQILNGKPEDRRRIFEEAVGLTKYKQRRKLTFRKLDATEQDLIRLADIIGEVRSKVNSLHRQVRRAQRYQKLTKNLSETEIRVATYNFSKIYDELGPLNEKFEESNQKRESLSSQISFKEAEYEAVQTNLIEIEDKLGEAQGELNQIKEIIHKREEEILLSRERLKSLAENKTRIEEEIETLRHRITTRKEQLLNTQQQKNSTAAEITTLQQEYEKEKQQLEKLDQLINEKRNESRESEQKIITLMQSITDKQRNLERLSAQLESLKQRETTVSEEKTTLSGKIETDSKRKEELELSYARREDELNAIIEKQAELELKSENLQQEMEQLKSTILQKNNQIESIQHRVAFIKDLLENYADYPEGVKYLLIDQGADKGFQNVLADVLSVNEQYQKAIETALGDAATYLIVTDSKTAYLGIDTLKEKQQGVVTFLPIDHLKPAPRPEDIPLKAGVIGWADSVVKCEEKFLPAVRTLLGSCLIVEDMAVAQQLMPKLSGAQVQIVTRAGEIMFPWGGIKGGKKQAESGSIIGRQDQLKKLTAQLDTLDSELEKAEKKLREYEFEKDEISRQKETAVHQLKQAQEQTSKLHMEISQIDYRIQQANERIAQIDHELSTIKSEQQNLSELKSQIEPAIQQFNEKQSVLNNEVQDYQQKIEQLEKERHALSAKVNQLNVKIAETTGNERNFEREYEQTEKLIQEHEATIEARKKDLIDNENQKNILETRIDELGELLANDYSIKERWELQVEELSEKTRAIRENIEEKSKVIRKLREEREAIAETLHEVELRISELRIKADNLYRRIDEEYEWELKREPIDPDYDVSVDEAEIERIRERIKRLGPVNLLALKEYEKEKERLDFLEKQQEDLITAEQNLKETIEHINQTAQEKFDAIFQSIRVNFIKVFKNFFPDGEADLVIEDNGDPLEANIEIKANPKGKRMESLTLLSGGEKALTAISLLFGIYLVKPSPICILDEVDAPLDDNNVNRFLNTLKEFSHTTQFVMITHNKITMKSASCLYGITMEESGVSKVVSVKLD